MNQSQTDIDKWELLNAIDEISLNDESRAKMIEMCSTEIINKFQIYLYIKIELFKRYFNLHEENR